jgi:hydrogenase maturation protein HypF
MEFQMLADEDESGVYEFEIIDSMKPWRISFKRGIREIVHDIESGIDVSKIAGKFHNTIARIICEVAKKMKSETGINDVVLSGGVFQNALLVNKTIIELEKAGFKVYTHSKVPPNDGGLSLGQAVVALFNAI